MQLEMLEAMGAAFNPNLHQNCGPKVLLEALRDAIIEELEQPVDPYFRFRDNPVYQWDRQRQESWKRRSGWDP